MKSRHSTPSEYKYRVSGHNMMVTLPGGKIAKYATCKEHTCYEQMYKKKSPLIQFSAPYYGLRPLNDDLLDCCLYERKDSVPESTFLSRQDSLRALTTNGNQTPAGYIILEDLNKSYKHPCILDMKLGTRTYWEGAPPEKVERHIRMCQSTTSGTLGIRVCGMRVYRRHTNDWLIEDKEWGKSLQTDSMLRAIAMFLYDGISFRMDILDIIITKLIQLRAIVKESNWRFWSSSILLTYEGDGEKKADIHLIDFGNCSFSDRYTTPDDGCILALSNMIAILRLIQNGYVNACTLTKDAQL